MIRKRVLRTVLVVSLVGGTTLGVAGAAQALPRQCSVFTDGEARYWGYYSVDFERADAAAAIGDTGGQNFWDNQAVYDRNMAVNYNTLGQAYGCW